MALQQHINMTAAPVRGGAITVRERGLLRPGEFSMVQNVKATHPGFEKRKGQIKQHSTADGTNQAMSMYQFKKTRVSENMYLVQMSDGDVLQLTTSPPGVTTGVMGSELWSGSASPKPASWSNLNDMMVVSTTVDQHKLYPGAASYVEKFVVYTSHASDITAAKGVLEDGLDYSQEVSDGQSSTVAILDSLDDKDAGDGIFIFTPVPAKSFTFTVSAANTTGSLTLSLFYWKNDSTWAEVSGISDGTDSGSDTPFGQSGTISWTEPTDIQEKYLFGRVGYWYLLTIDAGALDAEVEVSAVTYNASFANLAAMWDGVPVLSPIVLVYDATDTDWTAYSGASVDIGSLADSSYIYICSADPVEGFYIDPGDTPDAAAQTIEATGIYYWNGTAWAQATLLNDGTDGLSHPGWVTIARPASVQPRHMENSRIYGYWYRLELDDAVATDVTVEIYTMPYYDIHDYGYYGQCSCAWKERMLYTFADKYQEYVYITESDAPQILVGEDTGVIQVGDGRPHKVTAIKNFFNNVLVFQEEKGEIGGCVTLLQGYNQPTFGKQVLSTKLGTFSTKSVDVVENVYTATATDEQLKTVAFFISRYGIVVCDGTSFAVISDDIQNYFDTNDTNCIRRGYEDQMWLKHDPIDHVIRIGLVCGSTATTPNVFPVYDLIDRCWYFDVRAQELSFWENVEAGSGQAPIAQLGGGVDDGFLYLVNYGTQDVSSAIDTYVMIELAGSGYYLDLLWLLLQCKTETGNITLTTYKNGVQKDQLTLSMAALNSNEIIRRHYLSMNIVDQHISLKIQNSSATENMTLLTTGVEAKIWANR